MAINRSLRGFRENLQQSLTSNMIDAEEFVLLYGANQSHHNQDIYPQQKYEPFDTGTIDEEQCFIEFRFGKNDLHVLLDVLNIPDRVTSTKGTVCDGMEALCILLKSLLFPCRYSYMVQIYGENPIELCLIYN